MQFKYHKVILLNGEEITLREVADGSSRTICPVCGFISHGVLAWSMGRSVDEKTGKEYGEATGGPSFDICPCCCTQYGLDDIFSKDRKQTMLQIWNKLRINWLDRIGWTPEALQQLHDNLGIDTQEIKRQNGKA
jgi:hypothetical protein